MKRPRNAFDAQVNAKMMKPTAKPRKAPATDFTDEEYVALRPQIERATMAAARCAIHEKAFAEAIPHADMCESRNGSCAHSYREVRSAGAALDKATRALRATVKAPTPAKVTLWLTLSPHQQEGLAVLFSGSARIAAALGHGLQAMGLAVNDHGIYTITPLGRTVHVEQGKR